MRCGVTGVAAFVAAALTCTGLTPAFAEAVVAGETAAHFLFFSGADIWRNGAFSHAGFLWSYQGLESDGPVFKLLLNGGFYRYRSGNTEITGRQEMGAVLPGWRWRRPGLEVTVFAGLDV